MANHSERLFNTFTRKLSSSFINAAIFPENETNDALSALTLLRQSKYFPLFADSSLFHDLAALALDRAKETPLSIRASLVRGC